MDSKQGKAKPKRKNAQYFADDSKSKTEGKRTEGSSKWFSEDYTGDGGPPIIYEEPESYVSEPAASAKKESGK